MLKLSKVILDNKTTTEIDLSELSDCDQMKKFLKKTKPAYSDALNKSGFKEKLSYTSVQSYNDKNHNKQQKRKITWYSLSYSANTANIGTNIGKTYLSLIFLEPSSII